MSDERPREVLRDCALCHSAWRRFMGHPQDQSCANCRGCGSVWVPIGQSSEAPVRPDSAPDSVELVYRNWRGEVRPRKICPLGVYFGSTQWHHEPQWLLNAVDLEDSTTKQFALKDFLGALRGETESVRACHFCENFVGLRYVVSDEERTILAAFRYEAAARDFWRPIKNSGFKTLAPTEMVAHRAPSSSCEGQKCPCGAQATRKVGEEELWDRPIVGHNLTSYVCDEHFWWLMGPSKPRTSP